MRNGKRQDPYALSFPFVALARHLLLEGRAAESEASAREGFVLRRMIDPADVRYAEAESVLGGCLTALHRDPEAKPLLVESYRNLLTFRNDRSVAGELRRLGDFNQAHR